MSHTKFQAYVYQGLCVVCVKFRSVRMSCILSGNPTQQQALVAGAVGQAVGTRGQIGETGKGDT
jgi:hypothetical protein